MATITWPSTLPQTFQRDSYREQMVSNALIAGFEVGPSGKRRRVTANVFSVSGEMFMTTGDWENMQEFLTEETLSRSLCFGFPAQGVTPQSPAQEWRVVIDRPPTRQWIAEGFWLVSISLVVLP